MFHDACSMRILFFNYEYPPLGGGAANATQYLLREYANLEGLEVDLVTASVDGEYHLDKISEKISVHRLPIGKNAKNLHFQSQRDLLMYAWRAYFFAHGLIKRNKYDLTHSFFTVPCGFISYLLKCKYGLPYIVSLRGSDVPGYSDRFTFIYNLLRPLTRVIWKNAAQVVSNSQGLKELALKTRPEQMIGIIYNGIDIAEFVPDSGQRPAGKFIITSGASRLTKRKGHRFLVSAVKELSVKYPQVEYKVLGEGNELEALQDLVREMRLDGHVSFVGRVPHDEVVRYYQEASLFVLPSLNEGMSNAMLEALAAGLPIVSTRTGGAEELVQEGENGYFIGYRDSRDIAEKVQKFLDDPALVSRMGESSRRQAERMSWRNVAEKYSETYKDCIRQE